MITLALTALIVVCLSIGATIGLAVATIIRVNKGEDDDANYIERQAALTKQQEDYEELQRQYHFLASEMVYEGNSVQHWRQKALAYKECAGVIYELKSLLGVETPADVLEQVKAQQQEAEPVAYRHEILEPGDDRAIVMYSESAENPWGHWTASHLGECVYQAAPLFLHPPKPAVQQQEAEPYGYLRENDGAIQISIGSERPADRSGGYATPWAAIYARPPMPAAQPQVPKGCPSDIEVREAVAAFMKDTQTLPLEDCARLLVMRLKRLLVAAKEEL